MIPGLRTDAGPRGKVKGRVKDQRDTYRRVLLIIVSGVVRVDEVVELVDMGELGRRCRVHDMNTHIPIGMSMRHGRATTNDSSDE